MALKTLLHPMGGPSLIECSPWRYATASAVGTSHLESDIACQDAMQACTLHTSVGEEIFVAVAADGAGSASHAEEGATLTCQGFVDELNRLVEGEATVANVSREFVQNWVVRFQRDLREKASARALPLRAFACTFLAAVVGEDHAVFAQIGDGALVIKDASDEDYHCVFWPQCGEYAGTTHFITDETFDHALEHVTIERPVLELAVLTDGLQPLTLRLADREAHTPFFKPIFEALREGASGYDEGFSAALANFLYSARVNERTADDKTLLLASRVRPVNGPEAGASESLPKEDRELSK